MNIDKILNDRESRYNKIIELSKKYKSPVLTAKINYPGDNKNSNRIEKIFEILKKLTKEGFQKEIIEIKELHGYDGPSILCSLEGKAEKLKKKAVEIEEDEEIGRIFDLDIYVEGVPVSRRDIRLNPRKCIICGGNTYNCRINKLHSKEEVKGEIDRLIDAYIVEDKKNKY